MRRPLRAIILAMAPNLAVLALQAGQWSAAAGLAPSGHGLLVLAAMEERGGK